MTGMLTPKLSVKQTRNYIEKSANRKIPRTVAHIQSWKEKVRAIRQSNINWTLSVLVVMSFFFITDMLANLCNTLKEIMFYIRRLKYISILDYLRLALSDGILNPKLSI
jgi:hypothetical protein